MEGCGGPSPDLATSPHPEIRSEDLHLNFALSGLLCDHVQAVF